MGQKRAQKVCVVGGGLSGLSAAWFIREQAVESGLPVELTLLEEGPRTGGKIGSVSGDGYLGETGPNGFLDSKPATLDLCRRMGIEGSLLRSSDAARKRYIFSGGRLNVLPEDPVAFMLSDLVSFGGRARIAAEYLVPPKKGSEDETLADFVRRRLGEEALDKLVGPMAAGVFAGDPENMSLAACFPKVRALEERFGGLIRGMLAMKKEAAARGMDGPASAGPGGVLWSFTGGAGDLTDALTSQLGGSVVTSAPVARIEVDPDRDGSRYTLFHGKGPDQARTEADVVVLAVPAYASANLLRKMDPGIAATMDTVPYAVMAVVHVGYEESTLPLPLDGFGFLIPKSEGRRILGSLWASSIFPGRAPEGKALLTLMVGGAGDPYTPMLDEEELLELCRREAEATMGITAAPVFSRVIRWEKAIPQYTWGHLERVVSIEKRLADHEGLFLTGNAWRGVGINDCVAAGEKVAGQVVKFLGKP